MSKIYIRQCASNGVRKKMTKKFGNGMNRQFIGENMILNILKNTSNQVNANFHTLGGPKL